MANRIVKITLSARVAEFEREMQKAAKAVRETGTAAEKLAQQTAAFNALGAAATGYGVAVTAAVGMAVKAFADFDAQMSAVRAATHESAENMDLLSDAALEAGSRTVYSATEAAQAIEELSRAGVSTADILSGGLDAALDLAAAGGLDVAASAEIAATALKTFNLQGDDMSHVADLLSAGAGKAQGSVMDMAGALNQSALIARQTGLSLEETTAGLAAFAENGLIGSDAGMSFKTMLQALTPTSKEAADLMEELGIRAYDSQGEFIGLAEFAGVLRDGLSSLSDEQQNAAMKTIFGADAVRAANVVYAQGEEGIRDWIAAVDDQGYAAETAAMRLDNLKGDWEEFTGALDTAMITMGEGANGPMRTFVQGLTGLVNTGNELPDWAKDSAFYLSAASGAIGLAAGAATLGVPRFIELRQRFNDLNMSMGRTMVAGGLAGVALGSLAGVVAAVAAAQEKARQQARSYADTIDETTGQITEATRRMVAENLNTSEAFLWWGQDTAIDRAERLGLSLADVADATAEGGEAFNDLMAQLEAMKATTPEATEDITILQAALREENASLERGADLARQNAEATANAGGEAQTAAEAYLAESDAVQSLNDELASLISQFNELNGLNSDAISANAAYEQALDDVEAQVKAIAEGQEGFARGLDLTEEAGRNNVALLQQLAENSQAAAEKTFELDGNTEAFIDRLEEGRQALYDSAIQMGATEEEAGALADQIYQIPSEKEIEILAETQQARATIDGFIADYAGRQIPVYLMGMRTAEGRPVNQGEFADGGIVAYANGGIDEGIYAGGPPIHKFAEPETGWEAYISGKPSARGRNIGLWQQTGALLGVGDQGASQAAPAIGTLNQTLVQKPGVSDRRMMQVAAEEIAWKLG